MDDADAVEARWARGLEQAAQRAYARTHGVEPESRGAAAGRARWRIEPRAAATAVVVIVLVGAVAWWGLRDPGAVPLPDASVSSPALVPSSSAGADARVLVHVSGSVAAPGLVELAAGARVADAVEAAGGMLAAADESSVNLARPVQDGEHVVVAVEGEAVADGRIDLNRADPAALEGLPGVGPVLAARITADREANGPFTTVEDLGRVPGVGPAILAGIADVATVG
ncbi:ComEA family DNA-binding protein [Demequina sp. SYSU T00039]|uniref:ComEA family DNA-binding protein n=1 Tax=Demequina lignilytica TaxID=3051663 RepID=A0AAW7M8I1_9MICO|nr:MULTISPECIES: ComEA family DNA-binding protein [unclassified Demequina]MDN4478452.1 ComEA family DNA-binding protein [Demequina sp. SYSU T00039-1]MDN4487041.1 ComEA family DNA-binding protein [Demequina sp. SYSU T00039]MDN4489752.1 ComEA family DNA-binding protein [Demequina sp. SYSU T00068]